MKKILVWDVPVRLFHWLLASAFIAALALATLSSDEGPLFPLHAILGIAILFLVALRIVWGLLGTRWARFSSFSLSPSALGRYLRGVLGASSATTSAGHNPATSWFAIASILVLVALGATGLLSAQGNESVEDLHQALAWTMVGLIVVHVAGVFLHTVTHRENLAMSMVHGRKKGRSEEAIRSPRWGSGLVFLGLTAAFVAVLVTGYDSAASTITFPFAKAPLHIGEGGKEHEAQSHTGTEENKHEEQHGAEADEKD